MSSFIYNELGIKLSENKKTMMVGRLNKRLRTLKLNDFSEYCDFLFSSKGQENEMVHLVNAITTNKTDFFREPVHFDYLTKTALPEIERMNHGQTRRKVHIWSAGCSTGEEPYTLAMVLSEYKEKNAGFSFVILATDISTRALLMAKKAVYPIDRIEPVTGLYRKKYLLKNRDKENPQVRIVSDLRRLIQFGRLNFMAEEFGLPQVQDIIFCRNVIIYFDKPTQERLMNKFCRNLRNGGYLFLGHSESIHGFNTPLEQVAPTIYRKLD